MQTTCNTENQYITSISSIVRKALGSCSTVIARIVLAIKVYLWYMEVQVHCSKKDMSQFLPNILQLLYLIFKFNILVTPSVLILLNISFDIPLDHVIMQIFCQNSEIT